MIISITGIDGCGKSTQVENLLNYLSKNNYKIYLSKAYGNEEKAIFEKLIPEFHQKAILFLFQALHVQQLQKTLSAQKEGKIIVADRWDDSYLAYHSTNGVLAKNPYLRNELNKLAFEGIKPSLTFYLDVDIDIIIQRLKIRGESFLEKRLKDFFLKMRESYHILAKEENWITIDGTLSINEVTQTIIDHVNLLLKEFF